MERPRWPKPARQRRMGRVRRSLRSWATSWLPPPLPALWWMTWSPRLLPAVRRCQVRANRPGLWTWCSRSGPLITYSTSQWSLPHTFFFFGAGTGLGALDSALHTPSQTSTGRDVLGPEKARPATRFDPDAGADTDETESAFATPRGALWESEPRRSAPESSESRLLAAISRAKESKAQLRMAVAEVTPRLARDGGERGSGRNRDRRRRGNQAQRDGSPEVERLLRQEREERMAARRRVRRRDGGGGGDRGGSGGSGSEVSATDDLPQTQPRPRKRCALECVPNRTSVEPCCPL